MTFLVNPPRPIEVETDEQEQPRSIRGEPLAGPVQPVQRWIAEVDWWSRPVAREYWRVVLRGRLLCEIYRDLEEGTWYVERVYD
jgi:hypothetical protein